MQVLSRMCVGVGFVCAECVTPARENRTRVYIILNLFTSACDLSASKMKNVHIKFKTTTRLDQENTYMNRNEKLFEVMLFN